jgi:hypothetical protein
MKKSVIVIMCGVALLLGIGFAGFIMHVKTVQRGWPSKQIESAVTLGGALYRYHEAHGFYPEQLNELVEGGVIKKDEFERLQFRATARANPEAWLYHRPKEFSDVAIVAPAWVYPDDGHSGYRPTARADGGGELIIASKAYRIPPWATKSKGEQAAPSNGG